LFVEFILQDIGSRLNIAFLGVKNNGKLLEKFLLVHGADDCAPAVTKKGERGDRHPDVDGSQQEERKD